MIYNDLDLKNWRKYKNDITTDAIWISNSSDKWKIPKRDIFNDIKSKEFHGIFIPEIVYQMVLRYTKKGETVWDCFAGSGTTIDVCKKLNRKVIANDIYSKRNDIIIADSRSFDPKQNVQLVFMHPPYFNIIKFTDKKEDLSNISELQEFLIEFEKVVANVTNYLDNERFLILVCGHIYYKNEHIPLGFHCMEIIRKYGYKCKGIITKDYGETKEGHKNESNLQYYRMLKNGLWKFPGDNIFIMKKGN